LKSSSIIVAAIAGIGLMFLLGSVFSLIVGELSFESTLVVGIISYFVTGFISGYLANWKGAVHGVFAALLLWAFNLFYWFFALRPSLGYIGPTSAFWGWFILFAFIGGLLSWGIGAVGGFLGERARTGSSS